MGNVDKIGMLDRIMSKKRNEIVIVDIETTGFKPKENYIVEIGICLLDLETGKCKKLFDKVVREQGISEKDRNAWIFQNSDSDFNATMNAPLLDEFIPELQDIFGKYRATAFNKKFDFGFLRARNIPIEKELPCPMVTATPIMKLNFKNNNSYHYNNNKFKYPNVEEAWKFYIPDITYVEKHRAYDDAVHESRIVYEMYKKQHIKIENI